MRRCLHPVNLSAAGTAPIDNLMRQSGVGNLHRAAVPRMWGIMKTKLNQALNEKGPREGPFLLIVFFAKRLELRVHTHTDVAFWNHAREDLAVRQRATCWARCRARRAWEAEVVENICTVDLKFNSLS